MFSGIVEATSTIIRIDHTATGARLITAASSTTRPPLDCHRVMRILRRGGSLPPFSDAVSLKRAAKSARAQNDGHTYALPFVGSIACMAVSLLKHPIRKL